MEETLGEKAENVGIPPPATKKKVRVVKKIVKKKIIKKVPKRALTASNCNDLEKVASPSPNVSSSVEIGKPNLDIDSLKEVENIDSLKEVETVKALEVSAMDEDECQISGLVTSSLLGVEIGDKLLDGDWSQIELQDSHQNQIGLPDSDWNRIELQDSDWNQIKLPDGDLNQFELQDGDLSQIGLQNNDQDRIALLDSSQNQTELQESDWNRIELQDGDLNQFELQDGDLSQIGLQNDDQNISALLDSSQNRNELQESDQNRIELQDREHDANTMNVEEHEGEEDMKEIKVNSEPDGLKSQEAGCVSNVPSGKTVASRLQLKQMKKIFIHGLGQETKEEDVREVFEEVGEVEVKLMKNFKSGKNRGCGFITFASADLANLALTKYQNVEICGRPCHTSAIEGVDTILLKNIDKKWNKEHVVEWLQKIGIMNIDEVLVSPDPDNAELNRGFAFLEFETKKDAQMAYRKLQNENVRGKHSNLEVSWASPSVDPVEEEIKSVYVEHIPIFWGEKEVNDHFKPFGEIESIALAKNLRTAKRNDFAFVNYKTYEAAVSCIEALTSKKSTSNNGSKGQLKVSLTKSIPKVKQIKTVSDSAVTEVSQSYQNANRSRKSQNQHHNTYQSRQSQQHLSLFGVNKPPHKPKIMIGKHEDSRKDSGSSTTAELLQLLREQASWKQGGPSTSAGHHQPVFGGKQPYTELGSKSLYHHDPRAYHQSHLQIPNVTHHRPTTNVTSFPHYDQQRLRYASGSSNLPKLDPRYTQTRDQTTYPGGGSAYRRMH